MSRLKGGDAARMVQAILHNDAGHNIVRGDIEAVLAILRNHPTTTNNGYARSGIRYAYDEDIVKQVSHAYALNLKDGAIIHYPGEVSGRLFLNQAHHTRWKQTMENMSVNPANIELTLSLILLTADETLWNKISALVTANPYDTPALQMKCHTSTQQTIVSIVALFLDSENSNGSAPLSVPDILFDCPADMAELIAVLFLKLAQVRKNRLA